MSESHFLLQDWLRWAQGALVWVQGGGLQALRDASGSFDAGRDLGNATTGAGGAALTGDAFKRLTGFEAPAGQAPDGFNGIRDVFSGWLGDAGGGPAAGDGPGSHVDTPGPQVAPPQHFPLEDFAPGGPAGQEAPPANTRLEDVLPDDFK